MSPKVPVFLLKTKSTPSDAYEELFSATHDGIQYDPIFVPVLQHRFETEGMKTVDALLKKKWINETPLANYGGLIFTSQRAVEAFAKLVDDGKARDLEWPHLQKIPIYSVGPATTRALRAVPQTPPLNIYGEHTGNGDALAEFILEHYGKWYRDRETRPPLLFLVGETRRDIIPKTLMDKSLPSDRRIEVSETVVYGTGEMESFADDFRSRLLETQSAKGRWVVVFSPTGCDSMLRVMGMLDESGKAKQKEQQEERSTFVATIGPTTRDHLVKKFGFEPDVCSEKPSPEGVLKGIGEFMKARAGGV